MKRFAPIVPLTLVASRCSCGASTSVAATRVIGGTTTQIRSAPWAVFIRQAVSPGSLVCGGSIIDSLHVLTAAHCVYDRNGGLASVNSLSIRAGISNYVTPLPDDAEQVRLVSSMRVHPRYPGPSDVGPYDVAVLALAAPLDLSGPAVAAVAPARRRCRLSLRRRGRCRRLRPPVAAASPDGSLHWLTAAVEGQGRCGGFSNGVVPDYDAVALCASSPIAAVCTGDSGSGLVTTGSPRTIVGVVSAGRTSCAIGAGIYTYLGAPEILRFVQGDDNPPAAPRRTASTSVTLSWFGTVRVGSTLTCESGGWDGAPAPRLRLRELAERAGPAAA